MINWGYTQLCLQGGVRFIWINYLFSFSVWSIMLCPNNYTLQFFSSRGFCFFCTFTMSWGDNCNFLKVIKFLGFKICTLSLHSEIPVVCCYWKWYSTRFSTLLQVGFFQGANGRASSSLRTIQMAKLASPTAVRDWLISRGERNTCSSRVQT